MSSIKTKIGKVQQRYQMMKEHPLTRSLQALENYNRSQFNTIFIRDVATVETRLKTAPPITIFNQSI